MSKKYKYIKIRLASPEEIRGWSSGEVKTHETINYRTLKPENDGLFCQKIFGPTKDYQCDCGKSKRADLKGTRCEKCGIELTSSKVRRERMGHIELVSPVVHTWYLKSTPSKLALLLEVPVKQLEEVVYLSSYMVTDPGMVKELEYKQIISEVEYQDLCENYPNKFKAQTGAEAIRTVLKKLDLKSEVENLRLLLTSKHKQDRDRAIKRLEIVESLYKSDNKPEWMVLDVLPVIPPDLRPMVQLDGGRFATTDLNDLYRRILNRNNRLKKLYEQNAPHLITKNEKRLLQEAVDALIDNSKKDKKKGNDKNNRQLKSLSDVLRGKQGRFRQNLLGKRVDYSGRSVIVVGPFLKMYQCGIPKEMAVTLFKPFVIRGLTNQGISLSSAKKMTERQDEAVWPVVEEVVREHPVLLNRAPTLHRLGIQAFEPVLIEGKAIRLHPLVCTAFNADFDGDQMAVHVPLSVEAQAEARLLMLASNNILNPKDGKPVVTPSQDMILGNYYLSLERAYNNGENPKSINEGKFFLNKDQAYIAYKNGEISLHTRIFVDPKSFPASKFAGNDIEGKYLFTTLGKMIFNEILPADFSYLNEPTDANLNGKTPECYFLKPSTKEAYEAMLARPETEPFLKKFFGKIISRVFKIHQVNETSIMLDKLKDLGFFYSTVAGITISAADVSIYEKKNEMIEAADKYIDEVKEMFSMGLLNEKERKTLVNTKWEETRKTIQENIWTEMAKQKDNHIYMMAHSGSRGSASNFSQIAGMRGLMANPNGETIEVPVKSNFKEGLTVSEFFISSHGSRKGSTDTALKTASSGYLTRRLVDVSQDVIVSQEDCGTDKGFAVREILNNEGKTAVSLADRITGRYLAKDIVSPTTGEVLACKGDILTEEDAVRVTKNTGVTEVTIRSNLTCESKFGVCMKCYGLNLATNKLVEVGEAVGTVAAQSIGEPGTQLTMRTFHNGGVASGGDITQGLPRVEELFEARKPKGKAELSLYDGIVKGINKVDKGYEVEIEPTDKSKAKKYIVDATSELLVKVGEEIKRGDRINSGSIQPKELLFTKNVEAVQEYIISEVQKVYRSQGVDIADKHIEIIVRQMLRNMKVENQGETNLLPGSYISSQDLRKATKDALINGKALPTAKAVVLGITKAALASPSFLSAASFQETTRILTDAAIRGKEDNLVGLKENIIIGGLIPAGTGTLIETSFECIHKPVEEEDLEAEAPAEVAERDDVEEDIYDEEEYMDDSLSDESDENL